MTKRVKRSAFPRPRTKPNPLRWTSHSRTAVAAETDGHFVAVREISPKRDTVHTRLSRALGSRLQRWRA